MVKDIDSDPDKQSKVPKAVEEPGWGELRDDHFGYQSEEERLKKRGLEDWEMVEKIPESQHHIPYWFVLLFVVLLLIAVGFSFPFWGNRPDFHRSWFDWGLPGAVIYVTVAAFAIYWMVDLRAIRHEKKQAMEKEAESQQQSDDSKT